MTVTTCPDPVEIQELGVGVVDVICGCGRCPPRRREDGFVEVVHQGRSLGFVPDAPLVTPERPELAAVRDAPSAPPPPLHRFRRRFYPDALWARYLHRRLTHGDP